MNSTEMRDAIAKALGIDPSQIQVVDVDVAPELPDAFDKTDELTCQQIYDDLLNRPMPAEMQNAVNTVIFAGNSPADSTPGAVRTPTSRLSDLGGYPPISDPKGTWWASQEEKERLAFENLNTPKASKMPMPEDLSGFPTPDVWAAASSKLGEALQPQFPDLWQAATAQLKQQITNLQVANAELATRNDRQCATINDLYKKITSIKNTGHRNLQRKRFLDNVNLANVIFAEIFESHPALEDAFQNNQAKIIHNHIEAIKHNLTKLHNFIIRAL